MRRAFDIRVYKRKLRDHYKTVRREMDAEQKARSDQAIFSRVISMPEYHKARLLLTFVSTPLEVDTHQLIRRALRDGKTVAVPYCVDGTRKMWFYAIKSLEELKPRTFGVLEPEPREDRKIRDYSRSICILPGIAFDYQGYRLGYGGGYYDRFLSKVYKGGVTAGVCYADCTRPALSHGKYDVPCEILVTDRKIKRFSRPKPGQGKSP